MLKTHNAFCAKAIPIRSFLRSGSASFLTYAENVRKGDENSALDALRKGQSLCLVALYTTIGGKCRVSWHFTSFTTWSHDPSGGLVAGVSAPLFGKVSLVTKVSRHAPTSLFLCRAPLSVLSILNNSLRIYYLSLLWPRPYSRRQAKAA